MSDGDRDALIKVLGMLERQELVDVPRGNTSQRFGFNMANVRRESECGTVACIAGWAMHFSKHFSGVMNQGEKSKQFADLVMPPGFSIGHHTVAHAAAALRNYLTLGQPRWAEVMKAY
jgi:hypothetical protein